MTILRTYIIHILKFILLFYQLFQGFEFLGIKSKTNTTTGIEGGDFQLNIILFSLLRAAYIYPHFEIESELQGAGKFDDVVLSYTQKAKNEDSVIENKDSKPGNLKKSKKQTNISAVTTGMSYILNI